MEEFGRTRCGRCCASHRIANDTERELHQETYGRDCAYQQPKKDLVSRSVVLMPSVLISTATAFSVSKLRRTTDTIAHTMT